ncbi:hypothetical protein ACFYZJ_16800 [Streptomyces sp. NPDC001848]|uniref:hypothetical protein n=1 Tax=Streptomyces sp. NPDC001848 TaxID=3364618 RepID=UPI00368D0703
MSRMGALWQRWIKYLGTITETVDGNGRPVGDQLAMMLLFGPAAAGLAIIVLAAKIGSRFAEFSTALAWFGFLTMILGEAFMLLSAVVARKAVNVERARHRLVAADELTAAIKRLGEALEESQRLYSLAREEAETRHAALKELRARVERMEVLDTLTPDQAAAYTATVEMIMGTKVERAERHLDRMGWLFAASGWIVAVGVVVFGEFIPIVKR